MFDFSLLTSDGGFLNGFISGALLIVGLGLCSLVVIIIEQNKN